MPGFRGCKKWGDIVQGIQIFSYARLERDFIINKMMRVDNTVYHIFEICVDFLNAHTKCRSNGYVIKLDYGNPFTMYKLS